MTIQEASTKPELFGLPNVKHPYMLDAAVDGKDLLKNNRFV